MTTVEACHAALQDQRDPTNWYCVGINSEKKLEIQGKGEGGLDELRGMFQHDQVQFGCCTIFGVDIRNGVISRREKVSRPPLEEGAYLIIFVFCAVAIACLYRGVISHGAAQ